MVYFNCGVCGTGLRKNQVEQHSFQCKSRVFSCIDCSTDFKNDEYKAHIKCITESEKYESKNSYVGKLNKGELKQNAWFDKVLKAVESFRGSARAKTVLEKLTDYPNVPRKKAKFFNFMKNSFRSYGVNDSLLEEIWAVIESFDKTSQANNNTTNNNNNNVQKRQLEDESNHNHNNKKFHQDDFTSNVCSIADKTNDSYNGHSQTEVSADSENDFDWFTLIKNECLKCQDGVSMQKLEKKLYKKYKKNFLNDGHDNEEANLLQKFTKKLNKKLKKYNNSFKITSNDDEQNSKTIIQFIEN